VLEAGDVVSLDCGAVVEGWHGDSALTLGAGELSGTDTALVETGRVAMWAGIAAIARGRRVGDIGRSVEDAVRRRGGYGIVEDYVGHGIGTQMHLPPDVPNYATHDRGPRLRPGMCFAVEPMIATGGIRTVVAEDGWTVSTADGSRAAHWEHTVALMPGGGIWVLTAEDGGASGLAGSDVDISPLD
jgi:methionyl aminopeptidase